MKLSLKLISGLILTLLGTGISAAQSQTQTTSPYSMYGYGMLNDRATSTQRQMGGIGYAMNSGRQINPMNPASYAAIDSLTFLWDISADISFFNRSEDVNGETKRGHGLGGGLDYLAMQFPVGRHFGMSAGLVPYSSVGYSFGKEVIHGNLSNEGSGGITEAYVGFSGRYKGFSAGVNVSYNFGNIINDIYANTATGNSTLFEHVMQIRDWNLVAGVQYSQFIGQSDKVTLGAVYSPKKTMRGHAWGAYWDISADSKADTVGYMNIRNHNYQPNTVGVGINYIHSRSNRLMIEADFTYQDWSKARFDALLNADGQPVVEAQQFNNRYKIAVGAEYIPKQRGNYLQRVAYRVGLFYDRDYIRIGSNQLKDYGLSCGFGFPTPEGKTVINLGFQYKHRQASPDALVKENYFNITLGLNFNELWFWQRKLK